MQLIELETRIATPPDRCFLLSLSIDLHLETNASAREKVIAGVSHGLIGPGETVTWHVRLFGLPFTHQALITKYDRPHHFRDVMLKGAFRSFEHDHYFEATSGGSTLMRDELRFEPPFGFLGRAAGVLFLRAYLEKLLERRNLAIKSAAEGPQLAWQKYLNL